MSRLDSPVSPQSPSGVTLPVVSSMAGNNVDNSTSPGSQVEAVPPLPSSRASSPELTAALPASQRRSAVSVALTSTSAQGESVAAAQPSSDANDEPDYGLLGSVGSTDRPWLETMLDSARRERFGPPVSNTVVSLLDIPRPPSPRTARSMSPTRLLALSRQYADLARTAFRAREDSHRPHSDEIRAQPRLASRRGHGEPHPVVLTAGGTSSELGSDAEQVAVVNPEGQDGATRTVACRQIELEGQFPDAHVPTQDVLKSRGSNNSSVEYNDYSWIEYPRGNGARTPTVVVSPVTRKSSHSGQTISEQIENLTKELDRLKQKQRVELLKKDSGSYASAFAVKRSGSERADESSRKSARPTAPGIIVPGSPLEAVIRASSYLEQTPISSDAFDRQSGIGPTPASASGTNRSMSSSVGTRRHSLSSRKVKKSKMTLKPIPPTPYDGSPDPEAYMQFVHEAKIYLRLDSECDDGSNSENDSEAESVEGSENKYEDDSPNEDNGYWSPSQLSNSTRRRLLAEGRCFICERRGHIARNCPTWEDSEWENEDSSEPERDPDPDSSVSSIWRGFLFTPLVASDTR
ncbi:hypothetical protein DFH06DRAFT_1288724 [Mycena polygramma]|nr:hypothetical protein DFH06DRAFT_1288724 [Mycena polygramma]